MQRGWCIISTMDADKHPDVDVEDDQFNEDYPIGDMLWPMIRASPGYLQTRSSIKVYTTRAQEVAWIGLADLTNGTPPLAGCTRSQRTLKLGGRMPSEPTVPSLGQTSIWPLCRPDNYLLSVLPKYGHAIEYASRYTLDA